ncbi:hypothetical protein [Nocardiopsis deserti]|uniref:hypothetical protein n=1 Tax=Nocardiopsis deserti TaxID=2605988 RepID=UPI0016817F27|nr:hypothetical protein [Nocardiopsis deserti]
MTSEEHAQQASPAPLTDSRAAAEHLCRRRSAYEDAAVDEGLRDDLDALVAQVAERGRLSHRALRALEDRLGPLLDPGDAFFRNAFVGPGPGRDPQEPVGGLPGVGPGPAPAVREVCPLAAPCSRIRGAGEPGAAGGHCAVADRPLRLRTKGT